MKRRGEKFVCMTSYDALFAGLCSKAGVEVLLVGDSLGMVLQGHDSTLPVTMEDMVYHMQCVKRGNQGALLMADLPFMAYSSPTQTLDNSARLMRAGAQIVKLEGGAWIAESTRLLTERGIPVCAHMGLTPQSVLGLGGHRVQARQAEEARALIESAQRLGDAGCFAIVLECVPSRVAECVPRAVRSLVIGIGAGPATDGQVLVLQDLLGTNPAFKPRFLRHYAKGHSVVCDAVNRFHADVMSGEFPSREESYA